MTIKDYNEEKRYHPSLDFKDSVLVLGFRIKKEDGNEADIYIIKISGHVFTSENVDFPLDKDRVISIDKKKRLIAKISQKWSINALNSYIESHDGLHKPVLKTDIYAKTKDCLMQYVELENASDYSILTAWIMGTYFFPAFNAYPYIHIKAPKGSGKSQCLNFLQQTAFNAVKARASLPALRDTVDALRGTYIMDQADALNRPTMEDFLDILTDSYKKGGGSIRKMISNKNEWNVEEFDAYCPKAFGSINQLPEDLRDRCIVIPLIRSKKNLPPIDQEEEVWREMRGDMYIYLMEQFDYVSSVYAVKQYGYKNNISVLGRQLELWLPLETILQVTSVPEGEIETCKKRFLSRYEFSSYQTSEIELAVIETIILLMDGKEDMTLRPKEIASKVDSSLFEDEDKFAFASQKQKSTTVGRIITKFNLASYKLPRDNQGERYSFNRVQLLKIHEGYFAKSEETDTQTYTEEITPITGGIFSDTQSVT